MRAKEFLMKDSYSFDVDRENAMKSYEEYVQTYTQFFQTIGVTVKTGNGYIPQLNANVTVIVKFLVQANAGNIGGSLSHEYQIPADIGEDTIKQCTTCNWSSNLEASGSISACPECQSKVEQCQSIEVAHTFLLDDKYTKPLGATFLQMNGKPTTLMMGCYGIGISRLIAASIETLSTENEIRWPFLFAPYSVCIIPPKRGSREEESVVHLTDLVYRELGKTNELIDDIVVDDRNGLTIGKRLLEAKR